MQNVSPQERIQGMGFIAMGIAFNAVGLGRAAVGLDLGLILAYWFWLFANWRTSRERLLRLYLLFIGFFCLHFAEEYFTGFYVDFPSLFGIQWSAQRFVVFNLAWLTVFALSAIGVYYERSIAYLVVIFFALAGGILNGAAHISLSLIQGRYFPGTFTAPLMLAAGFVLLHRLQPAGKILLIAQAIAFTVLVPGTVAWWLPQNLLRVDWTIRHPTGWIPVTLGAALYFWCAAQFLLRGQGTPNISFAKPLAFLIGSGPVRLVQNSIYRHSRNPMYLGVITVVFGEAILFGSLSLLIYAVALCVWFHFVVVLIEEPHLRKTQGTLFLQYCRETPRWIPKVWKPNHR